MTGLTIVTDKKEYSRHEQMRSTVKVRLVPTPATDLDDTAMIVLRRKGGPVTFTQQLDLTGALVKGDRVNATTGVIGEPGNGDASHLRRLPLRHRRIGSVKGSAEAVAFAHLLDGDHRQVQRRGRHRCSVRVAGGRTVGFQQVIAPVGQRNAGIIADSR
jgi:hypothetical protein